MRRLIAVGLSVVEGRRRRRSVAQGEASSRAWRTPVKGITDYIEGHAKRLKKSRNLCA